MKNYDLEHDWLDFISEQKSIFKNFDKKIITEETKITPVANNLNKSRREQKPAGIVIHHTATNDPQTTLSVLGQRGYSTNYEVDKKGNIYQYINPDEGYAIATGEGANKYTVAIDVTTGNGSWSPEQVESVKILANSIAQKYGFQLKLAPDQGPADWNFWKTKGFTLFRHRNFVATQCPSTFPMDQIAGPAPTIDLNIPTPNSGQNNSFGGDDTSAIKWLLNVGNKLQENLDKKIFNINDKTKNKIYSKYKKYFNSLLDHLKKELKLNKPVKIVLEEDEENGKKVLGRTGGYINHEDKIHIFCSGRHIKDIMRSLSHELVHHKQNIRGEFKDHHETSHGYAQKDKHLRAMEKEAYLKGNILFRDWEDNYKYRGEK